MSRSSTLADPSDGRIPEAQGAVLERVRTRLQRMVDTRELPGAQYVVVDAKRVRLALAAGVADAQGLRPMELATMQMAYSITKVITAIAVMQLVSEGKLALDRPLSEVYADHPYGRAVTLRMLLAHTSAIGDPMPLDWFATSAEPLDRDARLAAVLQKSRKLRGMPGAHYRYSNIGYWLLEKAIERASHEDYAHYVQRCIFERIGVAPEGADFSLPAPERTATGHTPRRRVMTALLWAMTPSRYWARPAAGFSRAQRLLPHGRGYGGLFCNALALGSVLQDLLRDEPRLLDQAAREQMLSAQRTSPGKPTGGTLGWVCGALADTPYFGKQGGGFGFHGNVRLYPQRGIATVLLANRTEIRPGPIDARSDALDLALFS